MGRKFKDIAGQKFGRLTAIEPTTKRYGSSVIWKCKCDCGNEKEVPQNGLNAGLVRSCGCLVVENCKNISKNNTEDLTNKRFGKLLALEKTDKRSFASVNWKCKCDCGNIAYVKQGNLKSGATKSCGCSLLEVNSKRSTGWFADKTNTTFMLKNNESAKSHNKIGVRGVSQTSSGKYTATIEFQKKRYYLGVFIDAEDADKAYKNKRKELYGEFFENHESIKAS